MNRSSFFRTALAIGLGFASLTPVFALAPAEIDKPVAPFTFRNLQATSSGKQTITLSDYKGKKIVVIVFVANRCGMTWTYEKKILDLYRDYAKKGVEVVAIHSDFQESDAELLKPTREHKWQFPILDDKKTQGFADYMNATATPTFAIIDKAGVLRYKGGFDRPTRKLEYVRPALDALLTGKPVPVKTTRVLGCEIARRPTKAR